MELVLIVGSNLFSRYYLISIPSRLPFWLLTRDESDSFFPGTNDVGEFDPWIIFRSWFWVDEQICPISATYRAKTQSGNGPSWLKDLGPITAENYGSNSAYSAFSSGGNAVQTPLLAKTPEVLRANVLEDMRRKILTKKQIVGPDWHGRRWVAWIEGKAETSSGEGMKLKFVELSDLKTHEKDYASVLNREKEYWKSEVFWSEV